GEPAFELVVIVAVEQIVLVIVLIVDHRLDAPDAAGEILMRRASFGDAAVAVADIGVGAPGEIGAREIVGVAPAALVDERLQASAVGAGLRAEHTGRRAPARGGRREALR